MIPKIIHYCWLSDDPIPSLYQQYIDGWKEIMPDFQIKKWDRTAIDLKEHSFAAYAFQQKKYAFAADYIRAYALYTEGGIYLDSDVLMKKDLSPFLHFGYFTAIENHLNKFGTFLLKGAYIDDNYQRIRSKECVFEFGLNAAVLGAEKGHPLIRDILSFYQNFDLSKASPFKKIAPNVHAQAAEYYGLKYKDTLQFLKNDILILPSTVICTRSKNETNEAFAVHMCAGHWVKKSNIFIEKIKSVPYLLDLYIYMKLFLAYLKQKV